MPETIDPHLVAHRPIGRDDDLGVWIVSGYHEARTVLTQPGWSSDPLAAPKVQRDAAAVGLAELPFARTMLLLDGADHSRIRGSVRDVFTPNYIAQLAPAVESIAADIVAAVPSDTSFDFMSRVAQPFPITVIAEWLGLDLSRAQTLLAEAPTLVRALDALFEPETLPSSAAAFTALVGDFLPLAAQRRAEPRDDLLSLLATDPDLDLDEVVVNAILLAIAGHETTANLLGAAAARLFTPTDGRRPIDDLDTDDPRLVRELLRLDGPAQSVTRVATAEHEIAGCTIRPGDVVVVAVTAANRDPDVFEDPESFIPDRDAPAHLSFGFGAHRCVGAALAQLETSVALRLLLERDAEVTGPVRHRDSTVLHGLTSVPMTFHRPS